MTEKRTAKEHYQQLRGLSCEELWTEAERFDQIEGRERVSHVGVIRAVGVVFSATKDEALQDKARVWLRGLLNDPEEKVRRYAMVALPKIGAAEQEESELIQLLGKSSSDREQKFLGRTLEKIGGEATLRLDETTPLLARTKQKAAANVARAKGESDLLSNARIKSGKDRRLLFHCRSGLEEILAEEIEAVKMFVSRRTLKGAIEVEPLRDYSLGDVFKHRCFSYAGLILGEVKPTGEDETVEALARLIASRDSLEVFRAFTKGPLRYRLDFVSRGHQRGLVRTLTDRVYALCPHLLNDSRDAPWTIQITDRLHAVVVELVPRFKPDPRFAYRQGDVPAASHPPLAACMARLAKLTGGEVIWDPFCGSGLELIECGRLRKTAELIGTDRDANALETARINLDAAGLAQSPQRLEQGDFRDYRSIAGLRENSVTLIVSNPPMGRRVPIPNLDELIADLFDAAATVLKVGGRLVFANPLLVKPKDRSLQREYRQKIDLGGFHCHLEKYVKVGQDGETYEKPDPSPSQIERMSREKAKPKQDKFWRERRKKS